jgi:hypothetical protein
MCCVQNYPLLILKTLRFALLATCLVCLAAMASPATPPAQQPTPARRLVMRDHRYPPRPRIAQRCPALPRCQQLQDGLGLLARCEICFSGALKPTGITVRARCIGDSDAGLPSLAAPRDVAGTNSHSLDGSGGCPSCLHKNGLVFSRADRQRFWDRCPS